MTESDRMTLLIKTAKVSGQSLDLLWALTAGLSPNALARLCGNAEVLPKYIQSKVTP